ncbi:MAG: adenylate/guanylate cyclase domain-containing protein, partial [Leptospira sp.]|nr:adenylate/guanylate cyclase domain-containing protein [Leptospira sp.]
MPEKFLWMIRGFPDKNEEKAFLYFHDEDTAKLARIAIELSILSWTTFGVLCFFLFPVKAIEIAYLIGFILYPVFFLQIYISFFPRFYGRLQFFSSLGNTVAGLHTVYLGHITLHHPFLTVFALTLICIFAFLLLRLRFLIGMIGTLLFLIPYQVLVVLSTTYSFEEKWVSTFAVWTAELFALAGGYALENISRELFLKTRIIEDQQRKLEIEREKSERLLLNMLPASIAERLKNGEKTIADHHATVTILFADIVGFTSLSAKVPPVEVVSLLNEIFSQFDALTERSGAEKIKTIGDAYMAVAGIPDGTDNHPELMARLSLDMVAAIREINTSGLGPLDIRIGLHSGSVVAGVIGTSKFLYDIWGDTVNTASRMESHGIPGEIQVTE